MLPTVARPFPFPPAVHRLLIPPRVPNTVPVPGAVGRCSSWLIFISLMISSDAEHLSHAYNFFGKMSVQVLCLFINWVVHPFGVVRYIFLLFSELSPS